MTKNSPLFGSRPGADTPRSASTTLGDVFALQTSVYCNNLSLTEAAIWRISDKPTLPLTSIVYGNGSNRNFD
jgi:hypothetical protein